MATITAKTNDKVFSFQKWYGLNEHPDGDTRLRMGEASRMVNWRITRDGNLKLRPGQEFIAGLGTYEAAVYPTLTKIGDYKATDILFVSDDISDTAVPGSITMLGGDAAINDKGKIITQNGAVSGGIASLPASGWEIQNGVLISTGSAGTMTTPEALLPALDALSEEEFLYIESEGIIYAIQKGGLVLNADGTYGLSGYRVYANITGEGDHAVRSMWSGMLNGKDVFLIAYGGAIYNLYDADNDRLIPSFIGNIATDKGVHFFMFNSVVYILNGYEYYSYDGLNLTVVEGYRPLVAIGIGPQGTADAGELTSEYVNRLNGKRRVWISPDGSGTVFQLPEKNLASIDKIINLANGANVTGYTADLVNGTVTFTGVPPRAVNSYEIQYSASSDFRSQVTGNLFSELYSGTTDTRVFLYGDGTNKTIYSGMDYDGLPRADYFPDQYEVLVGDSNTPITSMIRHYGTLIAYKPNECWSLQHGVVELATGDLTPSIYCVPVSKEKGNVPFGQVQLVNNSPVTCSGTELYQWTNSSYYTSNLTRDERQAKRISDRIQKSIKEINFETCLMWDDNDNQEFYLIGDGMALVWNYAMDAWYRYEHFDATAICSFRGDLYVGSHDGRIRRISDYVAGDDGVAFPAFWESGAMDFGASYSRKYSAALWVGLKPISGTSVDVTVVTDRKNTFHDKVVSSEKAKIAGQPFMVKVKIKAKKFVFYHLRLSVNKRMLPVTVTNVEVRVRMTSDAK